LLRKSFLVFSAVNRGAGSRACQRTTRDACQANFARIRPAPYAHIRATKRSIRKGRTSLTSFVGQPRRRADAVLRLLQTKMPWAVLERRFNRPAERVAPQNVLLTQTGLMKMFECCPNVKPENHPPVSGGSDAVAAGEGRFRSKSPEC
jgi:hypothetical protein